MSSTPTFTLPRCGLAWVLLVGLLVGGTAAPPPVFAQAGSDASSQTAEPTRIVVRAVSNDAKLLQDPVGGARIRIENAETGEVLAEGLQRGDSGSTQKIMRTPYERGMTRYDTEGAAKFDTTLALTHPTRVRISATGPLDYPESMQTASVTTMLVPGEDITGEGVTLTLHGFIVEVLQPTSAPMAGDTVSVRARVRMMCGCPTEPGGLWDARRYTIRAELLNANNEVLATTPLSFTGTTNEYNAQVQIPEGAETLRVVAVDAERVNFGVREVPLDAPTSSR